MDFGAGGRSNISSRSGNAPAAMARRSLSLNSPDWDIATINHFCVEISVRGFSPLNPQTGKFGFRNDGCDGG
jgi:hypothetical protein